MTELLLTVYGDLPTPLLDPAFLLDRFQEQSRLTVRVSHMNFEEAWPKLLNFALFGGGPHISVIGSVWTSTLQSMLALRPFSTSEINSLGGPGVFFPAAWESPIPGESGIWSIPYNLFTYLILYRKDRLAKAGINPASAFASSAALTETVLRLKSAGVPSPLVLPAGQPFAARPHLLASWIWGAGGNFISPDGNKLRFTETEAIRGMAEFFQLYRIQSSADNGLSAPETVARFANGDATIVMAGATAQQVIEQCGKTEVFENIGVAPMPGVPWIGGANLVIWKEVRMNPEQEQGALALTRFLTQPEAQVKLAAAQYSIPARADALAQHTFTIPAFRAAVEQSVRSGRAYPRVKLWVRILRQMRTVFDTVTDEVIQNPQEDIEQILHRRLDPLSQRLGLMLE